MKDPIKMGKKAGNQLMMSLMLLLPAIAGGAVGAGLGRNSFLAGLGGLAAANEFGWPDWSKTAFVGMAVNGVATTQAVTEAAKVAETTSVSADGQLQGFQLIPDNFMSRGEQYLKNIALNAYLDKVPVVKDVVGLSGVDEMPAFAAKRSSRISLPNRAQEELSRIIANMESRSMGNLDAASFASAPGEKSGVGIDAAEFDKYAA